jgi:hypothetical protein
MNRLLLHTVACALLVSTVGATAAGSGTQAGHSPVYQLDVTYNGNVAGKVTVNTANAQLPSYVLVAHGLTPKTKYTFGYTASGEVYTIGSTDTPKAGALVINGTFPLDDVGDLQSAQFWVMETPPGWEYSNVIHGLDLRNVGVFVAKLACYYSTDGGVTWKESSHTDGISYMEWGGATLSGLGVPNGALVRIHAIVVAGNDKTGSEVFQHSEYPHNGHYYWAEYYISGTTLHDTLEFEGTDYRI